MLTELTTDSLETEINQHEKVLVQFSAGWCGNCRIMKPKFKKMANEHTNSKFYMIDAEKNPNSRKLANVSNLPTFSYFKNGELVNQIQTNKTDLLIDFVNEATSN